VDERPSNVVESLVRDGAAEQRARGLIPRPNEVHKYVQNIVEMMEKRDADNRLRIKPKAAPPAPADVLRSTEDMESEYQKRLKRHGLEALPGHWTVTRRPAGKKAEKRRLDDARARRADELKRARIRLLMSKPEWAARLKVVNPVIASSGTPEQKRECEALYLKVFEGAEAVFGPWWKTPPKKLWFSGK
jgi:hypothetical protein